MFKLRKCIILREKNKLILNFMASTTSQKSWDKAMFYHCVASPLLFITVCKRLGTEETSCSSLGIGMLSHSCLIQASSCSTVLGLLCRIFLFMMRQCFLWVKDLDCRLAISVPGSFFYAAMML